MCRGDEVRLQQCRSSVNDRTNCRGPFHSAGVECTISTTTTRSSTTSTTKRTTKSLSTTTTSTTEHATPTPSTSTVSTTMAPPRHITTLKSHMVTQAGLIESPIPPSPWVWNDETGTWYWNASHGDINDQQSLRENDYDDDVEIAVDNDDDDDDDKEKKEEADDDDDDDVANDGRSNILDTLLNDEAVLPSDHLAGYVVPDVSIYGSDESEGRYSNNHISLNSDVLTSPSPTTQTPWMWDDTLLQYVLQPQNGRRTESLWVWDHENEKYVLRSEYERRIATNIRTEHTNSPGNEQRLVQARQHDSAHVRDPLERMASDIQGDSQPILSRQSPDAESVDRDVYVPFIPEVANPDEYLSGTSIITETDEDRTSESNHQHEQEDAGTAPTIPLQHGGDHLQQYNVEHSSNGYNAMPTDILLATGDTRLNENPLHSTIESAYDHLTSSVHVQRPTAWEDPHRKKVVIHYKHNWPADEI